MAEPSLDGIKASVSKMISMGAPEADIDDYLMAKGVTAEQLRASSRPPEPKMAPVSTDEGPVYAPGQTPSVAPAPTQQGARAPLPVTTEAGGALARGAAQGATFGFADEIYGLGSAAGGKGYAAGRDAYRAEDAATDAAHPYLYGGAKLAGNVAGAAPAMIAAPGAFGLAAGGLGARTAASALSGAGIGAVQGFGEGEGGPGSQATSILAGGAGGAAFGAAAPIVGHAVGRAVAPIAQRFMDARAPVPGVTNSAASLLADDFANAGGRGAVEARLGQLGPEARLLDASPSFEGSAQGLAVRPETREMIVDPIVARKQGTNARLASDLDGALGPAPLPSQISEGIEQGQRALQPDYARAFQGAQAVDNAPLAGRLEAGIVDSRGDAQRAMRDVRRWLDIPDTPVLDPSPRALLSTRQAIDGRLATEADPNTIRALATARAEVDAELARTVPDIKRVDAQYAELARQGEGLQRGSQVLDGGKTAIRPADLARELRDGAQPQGEMVGPSAVPLRMRQGTRAEIDRLVGTNANDLTALKQAVKGEGDWNRAKLAQLFGDEQAGRIFNAVDREAAFDAAYNRLTQNSMTELRRTAAERFKPRGEAPGDQTMAISSLGGPKTMALAAAIKGVKSASGEAEKLADIARNKDIARVLLMQPGDELTQLLSALEQRSAGRGAGDRAGEQARMMAEIIMRSEGNDFGQHWRKALTR